MNSEDVWDYNNNNSRSYHQDGLLPLRIITSVLVADPFADCLEKPVAEIFQSSRQASEVYQTPLELSGFQSVPEVFLIVE